MGFAIDHHFLGSLCDPKNGLARAYRARGNYVPPKKGVKTRTHTFALGHTPRPAKGRPPKKGLEISEGPQDPNGLLDRSGASRKGSPPVTGVRGQSPRRIKKRGHEVGPQAPPRGPSPMQIYGYGF